MLAARLTPAPARSDAVDFVKALAIVAVSFTHAGVLPWSPRHSPWDYWLCAVWVNFQVPAFLLISGFLYHRAEPIGWPVVWARLRRVLVPYLVASGVAYALGIAEADSWLALAFQLVTASALGIYYFIFLLLLFIPTIWVLSRLSLRHLWLLCAALWGWGIVVEAILHLQPARSAEGAASLAGFFWLMRSPLNFTYAMFVAGWLAAAHRDELRAFVAERRRTAVAAGTAFILFYLVLGWTAPWLAAGAFRAFYTLAVVGCVALVTRTWRAPGWVRFLSDTSLGLYLYHQMFQLPLQRVAFEWPAPVRIVSVAAGGLAAAALLCLAGRRVLGGRARTILGA